MAAMTGTLAVTVPATVPASGLRTSSLRSFRVAAPTSRAAPLRLSIRADAREKLASERVDEVKADIANVVEGAKDVIQNALNPNEDPTGKVKNRVSGGVGEVRAVTNANKDQGENPAGQVAAAAESVKEAVVGAAKDVVNLAGGNEGYNSSAQKGAFTTPNREKMKANYNPLKNEEKQ